MLKIVQLTLGQGVGGTSVRKEPPGTVPRGAVRLEAEAAMGLDSVVTLALGLGTGGTAERRLRSDPRPGLPEAPTKPHSQWSSTG